MVQLDLRALQSAERDVQASQRKSLTEHSAGEQKTSKTV